MKKKVIVALIMSMMAAVIVAETANLVQIKKERDILSDVVRCWSDSEDPGILFMADSFLSEIGSSEAEMMTWCYCY